MAALIAFIVLAIGIGLTVGLGAPWLIVLPIFLVVAFLIWMGALVVAKKSPHEAVRETKTVEHLGPGGPDDPEHGRPS